MKPQKTNPGNPAAKGIPETPPDWMIASEEAEELYRLLASALNEVGLVRPFHSHALVTLCESWDRARKMKKQVEEEGEVLTSPQTGGKYPNPAVTIERMAMNEVARQAKTLAMDVSQIEAMAKSVRPRNQSDTFDPDDANSYLPQ